MKQHRVLVFAVLWLSYFAVARLLPASLWLDVYRMDVHNASVGEEIEVDYGRKINLGFFAVWDVSVWKWQENGWSSYCSKSGSRTYKTTAQLPVPVTVNWLTEGECVNLPAGRYQLEATWRLHFWWTSFKTVTILSNTFEVLPKDEDK